MRTRSACLTRKSAKLVSVVCCASRQNFRFLDRISARSDREKTFAKPEKSPFFDEKKMEGLKKLFGKLKVRYTDNMLTTDQEGVTTTAEYRVVGKDKHSVVISTSSDLSGEQELVQIHFVDSDTYWLLDSSGVMKEYFTRVK